jgi:hypothetical protein
MTRMTGVEPMHLPEVEGHDGGGPWAQAVERKPRGIVDPSAGCVHGLQVGGVARSLCRHIAELGQGP